MAQRRIWAEFIAVFLLAPVIVALALPPSAMFPALFAFTALGVVLLHLTPGFDWRSLGQGMAALRWPVLAGFGAVTLAISIAVVLATEPAALFGLALYNPGLLLAILLLYPFLSALPQEVVFRPLFFRRYGAILPAGRAALVLNAGVFSLAHLLYWNWIVAAMTFSGGLVFAWAYEERRSFPLAVALHAVAGGIVFAVGLGMFFYTGNIRRPF